MPQGSQRWTLAKLIDFEGLLAAWDGKAGRDRRAGRERAEVFLEWLQSGEAPGYGRRWLAALGTAAFLGGVLAAVAGAGAVWGTLHRELEGVHVIWLLGTALALPWLLFFLGLLAWLLRGRVAGFGLIGWAVERLSLRFLRDDAKELVERIRRSGELAKVLGWRLVRLSQGVAASYHLGALLGLAAMVLFKRVGFYWETTTERAMEGALETAVRWLSVPWSWWIGTPEVAASRRGADWDGGGADWWPFLILCLLVWGLLPRLAIAGWAAWKERRSLASLTFQAPQHRKLWRALTEVRRGEEPKGPVDGALVITIGGAEPDHEALRPFLLRKLRLNPTAWESLGVLDAEREESARSALAKAPAGIVLAAEGWSLAPRQMERALQEVAQRAGERRVIVLVANPGADGLKEATPEEREQWERFLDRREGEVELAFFEEDAL